MALLSWFRKKHGEDDYEQVLASLALSIQKRQTQLSEIRLRERRATLLATVWAFAAWVSYVGVWWTGMLGRRRGFSNGLWGIPVVLGPVVVMFTRRVVQLWYTRKGNAEETTLKELLVQQRNKIEEIKKKTNYYSTKNLLDRYDESVRRPGSGERSTGPRGNAPVSTHGQSTPTRAPQQAPQTPVKGAQEQPLSPSPALPYPQKQWYDKLADAILGDDTASTGPSPASRYALICERCFAHNGLVKEELWEDAQYLCPKCGHFNPSARARKAQANQAAVPQSPSGATSSRIQESSPATPMSVSHSAPAPGIASPKQPPLSESTVFIEKDDVERKDEERGAGDGGDRVDVSANTSTEMDVDS